MFRHQRTDAESELHGYKNELIKKLEVLYKVSESYSAENGDQGYLKESDELDKAINRLLRIKTAQTRELFVKNAGLIEFITQMDYIKEMIDRVKFQKMTVDDVAAGSEQMSHAIEEVAVYVQQSLATTTDTIQMSSQSIDKIQQAFQYINQSFEEMKRLKDKNMKVVENAKEIEEIVNIINQVAEQTNLLALNASIEAARAGEKGKGFAVVANEIKKLAENTKQSANYIKVMVKKLREEMDESETVLEKTVDTFSNGKIFINEAAESIDKMEGALKNIGEAFDGISANIEEQSATTQEISTKISEVNTNTLELYDSCIKTGKGIFSLSLLTEESRNAGKPWFKDFSGMDMITPMIGEHLLWRWKVYNVLCGFTKADENSINEYKECSLGKMLNHLIQTKSSSPMIKLYEPHKRVHELSKKIIKEYNNKNEKNIEQDLKELNTNMEILVEGLRKASRDNFPE